MATPARVYVRLCRRILGCATYCELCAAKEALCDVASLTPLPGLESRIAASVPDPNVFDAQTAAVLPRVVMPTEPTTSQVLADEISEDIDAINELLDAEAPLKSQAARRSPPPTTT